MQTTKQPAFVVLQASGLRAKTSSPRLVYPSDQTLGSDSVRYSAQTTAASCKCWLCALPSLKTSKTNTWQCCKEASPQDTMHTLSMRAAVCAMPNTNKHNAVMQ